MSVCLSVRPTDCLPKVCQKVVMASAPNAYLFPCDGSCPQALVEWDQTEGQWMPICLRSWCDSTSDWVCVITAWLDQRAHARCEMLNPYMWDGSTRGHIVVDIGLQYQHGSAPSNAIARYMAWEGRNTMCMLASILRAHAHATIDSNWLRSSAAGTARPVDFSWPGV